MFSDSCCRKCALPSIGDYPFRFIQGHAGSGRQPPRTVAKRRNWVDTETGGFMPPQNERGGDPMDAIHRISVGFCCLGSAALAVAASPAAVLAQAESYPARPVRVIVPFPPGGSLDFNARAIVDKLTENLGQQIVIDNRSGASGTIGTGI